MFRPSLPLAAALACILPGVPLAAAQAEPDTLRLTLRLLCFEETAAAPKLYLHDLADENDTPGTEVELKGYLNHESSTVTVRGKQLVFTASPEHASAKQPENQLAKWTRPDRKREWMLLFLPKQADGRTTWQVLGIDDSYRAFPPGSFQVLNLSRFPVRIRLESTNYDFKSGQTRLIENPPVQENQHSAMTSFCFRDNEWRRIGAGLWPHPGTKRSVQVLYDDPATGQVQLRGFRDVYVRDSPDESP